MATIPLDELSGATATRPVPPAEPVQRRGGGLRRVLVRGRYAFVCLGFVLLSVLQRPGDVVGDTKLDLVVDPIGFLERALTLWEPQGSAGQLQNQAYGYFFPMGPFFVLGRSLGLPPWLVQRLWLAALMSVAFLGVVVLARRLRIGTPTTALVAGIAYALAPRMVTSLGAHSVEMVPMALTPWVVVPLAGVALHGSARRAATRSGLAVFCIGGVNAVAAAAALPLAALFLLTRPPGALRRRLVGWWALAVALATAWWVGPLLVLGRYSPRFLDYIESAATTTAPTDVLSVLRGTSLWIASLRTSGVPVWPAGWSLLEDAMPVAATVVLAAAGLAALCRRDLPERRWLVLAVLTGVALVSMGHLAAVDGMLAGWLREALDGPLAPLRNVHKFDPVLRLPLVLGLAHLGAVLLRRARRRVPAEGAPGPGRAPASTWAARGVLAALVLALVGTTSPALAGRLVPPTGFEDLPGYWRETARFLADEQPSGRALLVPGSSFPTYAWGSATDEPLQSLAHSPWDVRNQIPLTPEGHIRMLDALEGRLSRGEASPGLAPYLARAGISHLVLRNDLDTETAGSTRPLLVRQALAGSPGITPVADFGPLLGEDAPEGETVVDAGLQEPAPAIQVYEVADVAPPAWTAPLSAAVGVHGGPDALLALEDRGLVTDRPTVAAGALDVPTVMLSDAWVRRERNFGRISGATSAGLAGMDPVRLDAPARDYTTPDEELAESTVAYFNGHLSASSSASDADGFQAPQLDAQPWSALDRNLLTAWQPAPWADASAPSWWRITTREPFTATGVIVRLGAQLGGERPDRLRLTTDGGTVTVPVADTGEPQILPLARGPSTSLTISTVPDDAAGSGSGFSLAEVALNGVEVQRTVVAPPVAEPVRAYAFDVSAGRSGCVVDAEGAPRCAATLADAAEESQVLDRVFHTVGEAEHEVAATGRPRLGPDFDAMLALIRGGPRAEASSSSVWDPRASPAAAVDGDPGTTWLAGVDDERPTLTLSFPEVRTIDSLRVVTAPAVTGSLAEAVTIDDGGGLRRTLQLDDDGIARFAPVVTDRLSVTFELPDVRETVDPRTGWEQRLGIAVSELEVGGPNPVTAPETEIPFPCGAGPDVQVDGEVLQTAGTTTLGALLAVQPVPLEICAGPSVLSLSEGEHRLQARAGFLLTARSVTLTRAGGPEEIVPAGRTPAERSRWDAEHRAVEVDARDEPTLLVVPENANAGWVARLDGRQLEAVTVDGWQQGYLLPEGAGGTVRLEFTPADGYRLALAGGAAAVVLLLVVSLLPARPSRARTGPEQRSGTPAGWRVAGLVAAVALGMAAIGGVVGVAALAVLWLVGRRAGPRRPVVLGSLAAATTLAAGLLLLVLPDGTGVARQVLAIAALAAVTAGVLPVRVPWRPAGLQRPDDAAAPAG